MGPSKEKTVFDRVARNKAMREYRASVRATFKTVCNDICNNLMAEVMRLAPLYTLKKPKAESAGQVLEDYGGHLLSLNFLYGDIDERGNIGDVRVGTRTFGLLSYETDQKKKTFKGTTSCKTSNLVMPYLCSVKSSLELTCIIKYAEIAFFNTLRVNLVRGAKSQWHTDAFKGVTENYLLIQDDKRCGVDYGCLSVDKFPSFRCSVVKFDNQLFIPISYSEGSGILRMAGFGNKTEARTDGNQATYYIFDKKMINRLQHQNGECARFKKKIPGNFRK